jgi:hypothetical protein
MKPRHATVAAKVRFAATVGEEPEVEVALVQRSDARDFLTGLCARGFSPEFVGIGFSELRLVGAACTLCMQYFAAEYRAVNPCSHGFDHSKIETLRR